MLFRIRINFLDHLETWCEDAEERAKSVVSAKVNMLQDLMFMHMMQAYIYTFLHTHMHTHRERERERALYTWTKIPSTD